MTNPQLTKNLLEVIRSVPDEDCRWLLEQRRTCCGGLMLARLDIVLVAFPFLDRPNVTNHEARMPCASSARWGSGSATGFPRTVIENRSPASTACSSRDNWALALKAPMLVPTALRGSSAPGSPQPRSA